MPPGTPRGTDASSAVTVRRQARRTSLSHHFAGDPAKGLEEARHALALRPHWPPARLALALCALALGNEAQARAALGDAGAPEAGAGDPLGLIARYNPAWAAHIRDALARLGPGGHGEAEDGAGG